jgi:cytochrome c oxidase cbb3-type subunit 3
MSSNPQEIEKAEYAREKGEVVLRSHEYDGIQEYDQVLPNWWLFIFYGTLVFFVGYWVAYYNFGLFRDDQTVINEKIEKIEIAKAKALDDMVASLSDEDLIQRWAVDPAVVESGKQVYLTNCVACHGQDLAARIDIGEGKFVALPGLSLNDGEWKYGSRPMEIFQLIHGGTPADSPGHNGARMEPWGQKMPPLQIAQLTAFLIYENPKDFGLE